MAIFSYVPALKGLIHHVVQNFNNYNLSFQKLDIHTVQMIKHPTSILLFLQTLISTHTESSTLIPSLMSPLSLDAMLSFTQIATTPPILSFLSHRYTL